MRSVCLLKQILATVKREVVSRAAAFVFAATTFGFASAALSQGVLLTFQGQVTTVKHDTSLASDSGLYPNQPFNFTIFINPSQGGTVVDANGVTQSTTTLSDPAFPGLYENAFYAEFAGGNRIWNSSFAGNGAGSANYGGSTTPVLTFPVDPFDPTSLISVTNSPWGVLIMAGGPSDNPLTHWFFEIETTAATLNAADPRNWQVGETFDAINKATLNGLLSEVDGTVTLTGISSGASAVSPVPEPSTFALGSLAVGLMALVRLNRRRRFLNTDC